MRPAYAEQHNVAHSRLHIRIRIIERVRVPVPIVYDIVPTHTRVLYVASYTYTCYHTRIMQSHTHATYIAYANF